MAEEVLVIDDRSSTDYRSSLSSSWRLITDDVMGGVSRAELTLDRVAGRNCLRLRGDVRLDNNGGFVQAALDLKGTAAANAGRYQGLLLDVYGNGEEYNLHLRSGDTWLPWQAYRATFRAEAGWHTLHVPFSAFKPYRIRSPLDVDRLERLGVVAIGRAFTADLCVASVRLYK